jgi:crotonobetainyl-CoA:carnitine CoA-transferase CaiB-like acyl-CoA transferase
MMNAFFKNIKVIELANVLAGPAVGTFFSELGADVIKIENILTNGDVTRSWKLPAENKDAPTSAYYASVNYNKKSIFVDLTKENEKQQVYDLIKDADIVISNYKPGDDVKLGMDYNSLKKINSTIILVHLTGFGQDINRTAYDLILQAETGFMFMNGTPQSGALKMPVALIDILAAHQMKEAVLMAIIKKMKTAKGSKITVSLFDAAIASLANQASNWLMTGIDPQPIGSLHPNIAPYGEIFISKDNKQIVLAIGSNKQFRQLCEILNITLLIQHPKFEKNVERVKNRKELFELLQLAIKQFESKLLMDEFLKKDVPAGIIKSIKEVFESNNLASTILTDYDPDNTMNKRVKTIAFQIFD